MSDLPLIGRRGILQGAVLTGTAVLGQSLAAHADSNEAVMAAS
jgi:hypothetical protein